MEITIDQEFRNLIPPLGTGELAQLEANILRDGCREPLVVWSGLLVDGHNRLAICTKHSIKYTTKVIVLPDRNAAKVWMIDNQMGKRNIADIDRIALANLKADIVGKLANKNESDGGKLAGRGRPKGSAKLPNPIVPIDTRKELAKSAGVGERTFDAGKMILEAAATGEVSQADIQAIRDKEKSIHRVAKDLKERRQKSNRDAKRKEAADSAEPQFFDNLHIGDFREQSHKVADGSLSLIFTDPPYNKKSSDLFDSLGKFANEKLADGGSLITYLGHIQLAEAMDGLSKHLRYWWVCCCLHAGPEALMSEYGIRAGWKPLLWFVKGTRHDKQNIVRDVISGGREKSHHDWQQSQFEAEYWISELCPTDGIVCDPFLGGGTTAAAAIRLQRKWIGFEVDHDQAVLAMTRVKA